MIKILWEFRMLAARNSAKSPVNLGSKIERKYEKTFSFSKMMPLLKKFLWTRRVDF